MDESLDDLYLDYVFTTERIKGVDDVPVLRVRLARMTNQGDVDISSIYIPLKELKDALAKL